MDWSKGFSASYYLSVVDRNSWRDGDRINITGGTIKRTYGDLRESADIDCVNYEYLDSEQIIRVWLDARQEGSSSHTPIFTGVASSPGRNINGRLETNTLQCYSILKIAQDVLLPRGWYAPADANGASLIKSLLSVIGLPNDMLHITENSNTLKTSIIAEEGENHLSMVDKILYAMNWRMSLNGKGEITIEPITYDPVVIFSSLDNDVIETSLSVTYDWYNCPNVYRAVVDDISAVAIDDSPDSPYSTVNRGREIWYEDINCYLNENESLSDYARRKLKESQRVSYILSYIRRFDPSVRVDDVVTINYPEQKIFGNYLVTDQTIQLTHGGETTEEAMKI